GDRARGDAADRARTLVRSRRRPRASAFRGRSVRARTPRRRKTPCGRAWQGFLVLRMPRTSYDAFKEHEGKRYTGMQIGCGHKWNYDAGQWIEKKVTPDKWEFQSRS